MEIHWQLTALLAFISFAAGSGEKVYLILSISIITVLQAMTSNSCCVVRFNDEINIMADIYSFEQCIVVVHLPSISQPWQYDIQVKMDILWGLKKSVITLFLLIYS